MNARYVFAATALWLAWGISWFVASWWANRAVTSAPAASYRAQLWTAFAGYAALFVERPDGRHALWTVPPWLGWPAVAIVAAALAFAW